MRSVVNGEPTPSMSNRTRTRRPAQDKLIESISVSRGKVGKIRLVWSPPPARLRGCEREQRKSVAETLARGNYDERKRVN